MDAFQARHQREVLGRSLGAAVQVFGIFTAVEPGNVGQKRDLRRGPVAVGAVKLAENVAGVK